MASIEQLIQQYLSPGDDESLPPEARRLATGLSRLLEVAGELAGEIDPAKVLRTIIRESCTALECERATLYRNDAAPDELYTSVVTALEISEIRRPVGQGISGYCAQNREIVHVPDVSQDPRWSPETDRLTGFSTRNVLAVPLIAPHDDSLLGVLQLLNRRSHELDEVDEQLIRVFATHAAVALDRVRLVEELRHREGVQASLEVAREIQRGFMPRRLPTIPGYELGCWWFANEAIGGDYCDVLSLRDGRFGLAIADVSGHGLGPSLIMASLRAALHAMVLEHSEPEVLLNLLARSLAKDLQEGRFITMVFAALDPRQNFLQYANAGHAPALHFESDSGEFMPLESTGMPLGVLDRPEYPQGWPIDLSPGDIIILATDGIVEAMDRNNKQFGLVRMQEIIRRLARRPVPEIVQSVGLEVERHYQAASPPDDLTILAIRRNR